MKITKTYDEVLADLQAVVAERGPGFVYTPIPHPHYDPEEGGDETMCAYFDGDAPSCGVGCVFDRWGLTAADLGEEWNVGLGVLALTRGYYLSRDGRWTAAPKLAGKVEIPDAASYLLNEFQRLQDQGIPYGEALARAIADGRARPGIPLLDGPASN